MTPSPRPRPAQSGMRLASIHLAALLLVGAVVALLLRGALLFGPAGSQACAPGIPLEPMIMGSQVIALILLGHREAPPTRRWLATLLALGPSIAGIFLLESHSGKYLPSCGAWSFVSGMTSLRDAGFGNPLVALGPPAILDGLAIALLDDRPRKGIYLAELLVLLAIFFPLVTFMGHVFQVARGLDPGRILKVSLLPALGWMAESAAILLARPSRGLVVRLADTTSLGRTLRILVAGMLGVPVIAAWAIYRISDTFSIPDTLRDALMAFGIAFAGVGLLLWLALLLERSYATHQLLQRTLQEREERHLAVQGALEKLAASEERYRAMQEAAPYMLALVSGGRYRYINRAGARLLGAQNAEELVGQIAQGFDTCYCVVNKVFECVPAGSITRRCPITIVGVDGRSLEIEAECNSIELDGEIVIRVTGRDLAAERRVALLEQTIAAVGEANATKDEFLRTISHELRTPLSVISGFAYLIKQAVSDKDPELLDWANQIESAGRAMLEIITEILDMAAIQAGRLEIRLGPVDLREVIDEVVGQFGPLLQAKDQSLEVDVADFLELQADFPRLRQVLVNLLANASRYSPPGTQIHVRADQEGSSVRVEIEDHGPGIHEAALSRLFQPFAVAGDAAAQGGIGLGLAICRGLIVAMQGTIGIDTRIGEGSTFWFTLPVAADLAAR